MRPKLGALLTHPIQYYSPWFAELAKVADLDVYYAHKQGAEGQARAGFNQGFEWDIPLLEGYRSQWLTNVSRRPGLDGFRGCDTPEIAGIIARGEFDAFLLFGWNRLCFHQARNAAARSGTPVLTRADSHLGVPRSKLLAAAKAVTHRWLLPRFSHYLSPGGQTDAYLRHYAVASGRIHRLPHMVDVGRFRAAAAAARASGASDRFRRNHGAAPDDVVFLAVGKLIPLKQYDLLLEALRLLQTTAPDQAARMRVWIAGEGPLRERLERQARDLPVSFLGFTNQSAMPEVYASADCLVVPSAWETWGLVVNEAFACGVPAIVSRNAGCTPELVREGATGWVLKAFTAPALAEVMLQAARTVKTMPRQALDELANAGDYRSGAAALVEIVERLRARGSMG